MKKKTTVKINPILLIIVAFFFVAIIAKLSYVALSKKVDGINLHEFSENRNTKEELIYAKRGLIYDKKNNVLAGTANSYKIIAYLNKDRGEGHYVKDKDSTAKALNEILGIEYNEAIKILSKDSYQVEFGPKGKNISETTKNKIKDLELDGIDFIESQKRTYSMGSFASYIIGYAKSKEEDEKIKGELGLESYYNELLSGKDGKKTYETDAYGYTLPNATINEEKATNGYNIYTTIDSNIQLFAETLTKNLSDNYNMDWMIFTVMDANTGAIVASSTYPNFDPNDLNTLTSYMNPLVSYEYEPGSTMKIFSFASSIEEGLYDGNKTFKSGSINVADATIKDFNKIGWGTITYDTGFAYSSNVGATNLGLELGVKRLTSYYDQLGFGDKTGIELANEVKGKINFQYKSELATASFGQGITVTPIQMMQALTALTNDGTTLKPYVVSKIVDDEGNVIESNERTEVRKVYSAETMTKMRSLMHNVVYDGLSNYWRPSKTSLIGKTGTAQIASPKGGYLSGTYDYIRSFAGIFPEDDPKYIAYVAVKQINSNATAIAKEYTKAIDDIVSYLGMVEKEVSNDTKVVTLTNYISKSIEETINKLSSYGLNVIKIGNGPFVINQYPNKDELVLVGSKVFIVTNSKDIYLENLYGWTSQEVSTYANLLGIKLNIEGYGKVVSQSLEAGSPVTEETVLSVTLQK